MLFSLFPETGATKWASSTPEQSDTSLSLTSASKYIQLNRYLNLPYKAILFWEEVAT